MHSSRNGELVRRCPSGEEAQSDPILGARQQIPAHLTNQHGRVYYRLMTAELTGRLRLSAGRRRRDGSAEYQRNSSTRVKRTHIIAADAAESR